MEYGQQGQHGRVDEYGNPVAGHGAGTGAGGMGHTGTGGMGMGTHGGAGTGAGMGGQFQPSREEHKTGGILHRSGSSSSSSSEDDGMGGRRKKGLKEKIREKLPGGHKDDQQIGGAYGQQGHTTGKTGTGGTYGQQGHTGMTGTGTGTGGAYGTEGTGEKKGIMDKIKEKLPGGHKDDQQMGGAYGQQGHTAGMTGNSGTYGQQGHTGMTGTGTGTGGAYGTEDTGEKKGIMDKIKEKLPGQH